MNVPTTLALIEPIHEYDSLLIASGIPIIPVTSRHYRSVLDPYRDSAGAIEASDLDYTILRPGWFTQERGRRFHITHKGEPFQGHDVSLDALSGLIVELCTTPGLHVRESLGVSNV